MRWTIRIAASVAVLAALWEFGPRDRFDRDAAFEPAAIGADVAAYLEAAERNIPALRPGAEKSVVWADPATKARTPLSIVYFHGFSATKEESRPVPDLIAKRLGANLFYTRLKGHGRDGPAMDEARAGDWWRDAQEALAIGRRLGDRVLLIGGSTGATLATVAMADPELGRDVAGLIAFSPNYRFFGPPTWVMTAPFARQVLPPLYGAERSWTPQNDAQARWWTTSYPSAATFPMAALVEEAGRVDYAAIRAPALFIFNDGDEVVDHARTREVAALWGGAATIVNVDPDEGEAPARHAITGAIMAPSTVDEVVEAAANWAVALR